MLATSPDLAGRDRERNFGGRPARFYGQRLHCVRGIGVPVEHSLIALGKRRYAEAASVLLALRPRLCKIGGSKAICWSSR